MILTELGEEPLTAFSERLQHLTRVWSGHTPSFCLSFAGLPGRFLQLLQENGRCNGRGHVWSPGGKCGFYCNVREVCAPLTVRASTCVFHTPYATCHATFQRHDFVELPHVQAHVNHWSLNGSDHNFFSSLCCFLLLWVEWFTPCISETMKRWQSNTVIIMIFMGDGESNKQKLKLGSKHASAP